MECKFFLITVSKPPKPMSAPLVPADEQNQKFLKGNSDIGFRIKKGRMTFLSRKLLNSLMYRAQNMGLENKGIVKAGFGNAVIPDGLHHENFWWIELGEVVKDASFNSRDYSMVKEYLTELQQVLIIGYMHSEVGKSKFLSPDHLIQRDPPRLECADRTRLFQ